MESKAATASRDSVTASKALYAAGYLNGQKPPASDAQGTVAQNRLDTANSNRNAIYSQADQLHREYLKSASHHATGLKHADQKAPHKPGLLSRTWHDVSDWATKDLPEELAMAGDLSGDISAGLSILGLLLAPIPGVDIADLGIEPAAEATAIAALGFHAAAMALGDKDLTWRDLTLDGVAVATVGISKAAEAATKVVEAGTVAEEAAKLKRLALVVAPQLEPIKYGNEIIDKFGAITGLTVGWTSRHLKELNPASWFGDDKPKSSDEASSAFFSAAAAGGAT